MTKLLKCLAIAGLFIITSQGVNAQSNTMYYMRTVPQAYYLNPATQPGCSFYLGAPALSPLQISYDNSGISPNNIIWKDEKINPDSLIHPLYSAEASDIFLKGLKDVEYINADMAVNLASFGFRVNEMYFSLDATVKGSNYISYPKDLLTLLLKGNSNNQVFDLSGFNIDLLYYMDVGLNISRNFGDQLTVGIRPKMLYGLATVSSNTKDISLQTSTEEWVLNSNFDLNLAGVGLDIALDENGVPDLADGISIDSNLTDDPAGNWKNALGKNRGLGVDLGVHYRPMEEVELSLSVLDLGFINWKNNAYSVAQNGSYTFQGIEWNLSDSSEFKGDDLVDSIKSSFAFTGGKGTFKTSLRPKLIVGGRFFLAQELSVGVLSRTEFHPAKVEQDIILLANLHPMRGFSLTASYSLMGKSKSAIGVGLGMALGPFNYYLVSDFIPLSYDELTTKDGSSFPLPANAYRANLRFGLNLVFGCNQNKKLRKDKPLFEETNWMY